MDFDFVNLIIEEINIVCALIFLPLLFYGNYPVVVVLTFEIEVIKLIYF